MLQTPPLSLYVHIPWCVRKCPYCDFNSYAARGELPEAEYVAALLGDLDRELQGVGRRRIETMFIGGGTPSLFSPEAIAELLQGIARRLPMAPEAEITLEANPGTVDAARFRGFRAAGVNRLSIGVQSFDDALLHAIGRIHSGAEAIAAAEAAREAGFTNLNLDLMFGLPGQHSRLALADVVTAVRLAPTHISFYHLTLEPNTAFSKQPPVLPDEDAVALAQRACQQVLAAAGYGRYEVSAHARPGYTCRHNLNYWRHGDYLGIGAGAHGKITDAANHRVVRTSKVRKPESYLQLVPQSREYRDEQIVPPEDRPLEFLMNRLRLGEGFPEPAFPACTGLAIGALEPQLTECIEQGLLTRQDGWIRCTARGWNFLDDILQRFVR